MVEEIRTSSLHMTWMATPWDEVVCRFPVLHINSMRVVGPNPENDMQEFERRRDSLGVGLVSCRLSHDCLVESMLLEEYGFRFIEMQYSPELELSGSSFCEKTLPFTVMRASEGDMPQLQNIAHQSFTNERFRMDRRLDPKISAQRFENWVSSSLHHPTQELYVICDSGKIVAFFITELFKDGTCYWHLNAVSPELQGIGYGLRAWISMLNQAAAVGARSVRTSIAARNHKVLNLYARLGFKFPPPSMTFHWVKMEHNKRTYEIP